MIRLRSIAFNTLFYMNLILQMIVLTPIYFIVPRKVSWFVPKNWARTNNWLFKTVVGTTFEIEGLENIPKDGNYIFSPKHQSFWDVYALLPWLSDPFYILKRELMWIPLFGFYVMKQRMVPVNRAARGREMASVMARARAEMQTGRQLIIYPEGTRKQPGAAPDYKYGIARLYRDLQSPVVPVVMHPGLFWPRRSTLRYGGHFKVRILPPIPPGLDPDIFFEQLKETMERESDRLLLETVDANPHVPLPAVTADRVATLRALQASGQSIG